MDVIITRPNKEDREELNLLFTSVITDAFEQDGIGDRHDGIQEEIEKQLGFLDQDFATGGTDVHFLIARSDNKILGSIAYQGTSDLIKEHLNVNLENVPEVTSVLVLPEYQGKGVGTLLSNAVLTTLQNMGTREACLDGGYKKSQSFWIKKLGNPNILLKDHYGKGLDYMIWHRSLDQIPFETNQNL